LTFSIVSFLIPVLASLYYLVAQIFQLSDCSIMSLLLLFALRKIVKISHHYNFSFPRYDAIILTEYFLIFHHYFISKGPSDFSFSFIPPFISLVIIRLIFHISFRFSIFFLTFSYPLTDLFAGLSSALFFRETTRSFNHVALSFAQDPCVSSYSAIAPLFQFLRLSYSSLPLSVSAALYSQSHPLQPLGELYPVNRGTLLVTVCNLTEDQTKRNLTYHPPPLPTYLSTLLSYPILFYPPTLLSRVTVCPREKRIRGKARVSSKNQKKDTRLHCRNISD